MILLEPEHLSPIEPSIPVKIKLLLRMVFRFGNELYSWGKLDLELSSIKLCSLFDWPIRASMRDIQCEFLGWYSWTLSHRQNVSTDDVAGYINSYSRCNCRQPSPHRFNEKWSLHQALICSYHMFIDKSVTISH